MSGETVKKSGFRILLYHSIGDTKTGDVSGTRISTEVFTEQMNLLHARGYNVLGLAELIEAIKENKEIPGNSIAISFDDGYKDMLANAVPILRKYNFPATVFVVPSYVEGNMRSQHEYLSWEDLRGLGAVDIVIGSHSRSHRPLADLSLESMKAEVSESKQVLEEELGSSVDLFSYPHGSVNESIERILSDTGYKAAAASLIGVNYNDTDIFDLRRTEIRSNDGLFEFEKKISGCYDWIGYFK